MYTSVVTMYTQIPHKQSKFIHNLHGFVFKT